MKLAYNHELLIGFTTQTPYQSYETEVTPEQFRGYVRELSDTGIDILMCCPTAWRLPVYRSEVNRVWQTWGPNHKDPNFAADWKYFDRAFHRVREYMVSEAYEDPVEISLGTAREVGISPWLSYRMNDHHYMHYTGQRVPPTHDPFWQAHPEFRLSTSHSNNYLVPEVREWYYAILEELVNRYEAEGLELDFMRSTPYFEPNEVPQGTPVMTEFVRRLRRLTQAHGMKLGVRVPQSIPKALEAGLDVPTWKKEGLIDLITVSTFFITSPVQDVEAYKALPGEAEVLGELHFITDGLPMLGCNVSRRTGREIYLTMAASLMERGADGVSFFNFSYVRDHHFNDPRQRAHMSVEPPFDIFAKLRDADYRRRMPLHTITRGARYPWLTARHLLELEIHLPAGADEGKSAMLRVEMDRPGFIYRALSAECNGVPLTQVPGSGELFQPLSNFDLPSPECLFYFQVPPDAVRHGWNHVKILTDDSGEYSIPHTGICVKGVEMAVYK